MDYDGLTGATPTAAQRQYLIDVQAAIERGEDGNAVRLGGAPAADAWPYVRTSPRPALATIYFIGPDDGPIKIGWARNITTRVRDLRLANAYPLRIWASTQAAPALEREYHKRFAAHRLHGEWFDRHPDILAEIERLNG